jgi:type I restriction enzyme M protein
VSCSPASRSSARASVNKVYDPACGSGSLLLKFAKVLGKENVRQGFFGQEINLTTYNLARINMFLHDVNYEQFDIAHGDTLIDPAHWDDEPFEAIVSNPPYSTKWAGSDNPLLINDPRFAPAGVLAPKSKADLAFTMHILSWLAVDGTAAIVEFPGVLYRGGRSRRSASTSSTTTTSTRSSSCRPTSSSARRSPPASSCSRRASPTTRSSSSTVGAVHPHGQQEQAHRGSPEADSRSVRCREPAPHFAALVDALRRSRRTAYNLSVTSYVEAEDTTEEVDIVALNAEIARIVARQSELRTKIDAIVADLEGASS